VNADNPVTMTNSGVTYSLANPYDFAFPAIASGGAGGLGISSLAGWYGSSVAGSKFGATDGDQTTGGQISFGLSNNSNRALGLLATSSTGGTAFGARFINGSGITLTRMNLQFTGEVWRQSDKSKTLQFSYFVDLTGTNTFATNVTAFLPALNVNLPTVPADVNGVAVDGTLALNQTNLSVLNQTITNWPPGAALWLAWRMPDLTGKAQGLAVDNLSFSASVPAPVLDVISDRTVYAGMLLNFAVSASDPAGDPLVFSLGAGAPAGASVDQGGVFNWRPTLPQAPSTNTITLTVSDSGVPSLSASRSFTVTVFPPPRLGNASVVNHSLTFSLPTLNSQQYQVEYTDQLEGNLWTPLGAPITGTGGSLTNTIDITGAAQRFYRVRLVE
jgi:hypothetical protein